MPKPSGVSGFFQVRLNEEGHLSGTFEQTLFSADKAEVELQMVIEFIASMNKTLASSDETFFLSNPRQNQENDFDFTVDLRDGPAYLELTEIAPLKGPYATAPSSYKPYELAQSILGGIVEKSHRYVGNQGSHLFLLLYTTHWSFVPSRLTLACLRYWSAQRQHAFRAIFAFHLLEPNHGVPEWIFPYPPDLLGSFDPEAIRDDVCMNLDPRKFEVRFANENGPGSSI